MLSLKSFLTNCQLAVRSQSLYQTQVRVHVVLGNEASDLDSMISSLCFAYFRHCCMHDSMHPMVILPVSNIVRRDLPLRQDVSLLLKVVGLDINDIICVDDVNWQQFNNSDVRDYDSKNNNFTMTLTDHNKLSPFFSRFSSRVIEIIDHHQDEGAHTHISAAVTGTESEVAMRNIAFDSTDMKPLVASACTLVSEYFTAAVCRDQHGGHTAAAAASYMTAEVATCLAGAIAIDTHNMQADRTKGTARDSSQLEITSDRSLLPRGEGERGQLSSPDATIYDINANINCHCLCDSV